MKSKLSALVRNNGGYQIFYRNKPRKINMNEKFPYFHYEDLKIRIKS